MEVEVLQRSFVAPIHMNSGDVIEVSCGQCTGRLHMRLFVCPGLHSRCIEFMGLYVTPKEFTKVAGKDKQKDWKGSIRINNILLRVLMANKTIDFYNHDRDCSKRCVSRNHLTQNPDGSSRRGRRSRESAGFYHQPSNPAILVPEVETQRSIVDPYPLQINHVQQIQPNPLDYAIGVLPPGMVIPHGQVQSVGNMFVPLAASVPNPNFLSKGKEYRVLGNKGASRPLSFAQCFVSFVKKEVSSLQAQEKNTDNASEQINANLIHFLSALPTHMLAVRIHEGLKLEDSVEPPVFEVGSACEWSCPCTTLTASSNKENTLTGDTPSAEVQSYF